MDNSNLITIARDLLNFIEEEESKLHNWGFYSVRLSVSELETLIEENAPDDLREKLAVCAGEGMETGRIIDRMVRTNMLVPLENKMYFRSRFAEGLRLTANLKQRFRNDDWSSVRGLYLTLKYTWHQDVILI